MVKSVASAVIGGASSLLGSSKSSSASSKAASEQAAATTYAADLQKQASDESLALQKQIYGETKEAIEPYRQYGLRSLGRLERLSNGTLPVQQTAAYNFAMDQGLKSLGSGYAARGLANSGARTKAAIKYGSGLASSQYGDEYNRLSSMAGVGQNATNALSSLGSQYSSNVSNLLTGTANNLGTLAQSGANARASGYVGSANAYNSGLSGVTSALTGALGYLGNSSGTTSNSSSLYNPFYTGVTGGY